MGTKGTFVLLLISLLVLGIAGDKCGAGVNKLKKFQATVQAVNVTCTLCEFAVEATRAFISANNATEKDLDKIAAFFCVAMKIEDRYVCDDIVNEFQAEFYYLLSDPAISNGYFCAIIGSICPMPYFPGWNVTLTPTPPAKPYPGPNPANPTMYVLHVTDIHIDLLYTPGLMSNCGEPICCRPPNPAVAPFAGKWGDYNCDLAPWLYENMLQWIGKNLPNISYAIFTGDMPPHDVWDINRTAALAADAFILETWNTYLPNVKLFPAVGNHESVPVNEFAPRSVGGYWNMSWLYSSLAERWSDWLPQDALEEAQYAGYYSALSPDGVRIISLNTNLGCNTLNWFLTFPSNESADPDQQLHWFANTLAQAEQNNEMVYIIKHIPPSDGDCGVNWWRNYLNIMDRYKNIIMGDFAGHTHADKFIVSYQINGTEVRPVVTTLFPGSVTPDTNENPGFRVLEIDSVTKAVIDYTEYYINLTETNLVGSPNWQILYTAREAYDLPDMSPSAFHELALRMHTNESLLLDYWGRLGKDAYQQTCDKSCLHGVWCGLWNAPADAPFSICGK